MKSFARFGRQSREDLERGRDVVGAADKGQRWIDLEQAGRQVAAITCLSRFFSKADVERGCGM